MALLLTLFSGTIPWKKTLTSALTPSLCSRMFRPQACTPERVLCTHKHRQFEKLSKSVSQVRLHDLVETCASHIFRERNDNTGNSSLLLFLCSSCGISLIWIIEQDTNHCKQLGHQEDWHELCPALAYGFAWIDWSRTLFGTPLRNLYFEFKTWLLNGLKRLCTFWNDSSKKKISCRWFFIVITIFLSSYFFFHFNLGLWSFEHEKLKNQNKFRCCLGP